MDLLRWMGRTFARFVGLILTLYGLWMIGVNIVFALSEQRYSETWVLPSIFVAGAVAAAGGIVFLLSFDGPRRFRTRSWRGLGLAGMVLATVLPTSISLVLLVLSLSMIPSLFSRRSVTSE